MTASTTMKKFNVYNVTETFQCTFILLFWFSFFDTSFRGGITQNSSNLMTVRVPYGTTKTYHQLLFFFGIRLCLLASTNKIDITSQRSPTLTELLNSAKKSKSLIKKNGKIHLK